MTNADSARGHHRDGASAKIPPLPTWATRLVGQDQTGQELPACTDTHPAIVEAGRFALASVCVRDAVGLEPAAFQQRTAEAYARIAAALADCRASHPVRFWNFVPHIQQPLGAGLSRYMAFNAGRFTAFTDWFGGISALDRRAPAATGIGHLASDLVIYALAVDEPGVAVTNPRQQAPHHYSLHHGRLPPCFARATLIRSEPGRPPWLLVAGTASIRGQDSLHAGDLLAQCEETVRNLASVVREGTRVAQTAQSDRTGCAGTPPPTGDARSDAACLAQFRHLRVYYLRAADRPRACQFMDQRFPASEAAEFVQAEMCRPELLVEMEGVAELTLDDGS